MMHPVSTLSTPDVRAARHAARNTPCVTERSRPIRVEGNGFTLVELILTVVIIGILAGIGFPAFQQLTQSTNARRGIDNLASGFVHARTMAVTNGVAIKLCAVNGGACSNAVGDWEKAWAVFEDCDGDDVIDDAASSVACTPTNSNVDANSPEPVYARGIGNDADWSVKDDIDSDGPTIFTFQPNGRVFSATSDWPVTFELTGSSTTKKNRVIVSRLGQVCVEVRESGECG